MTVVGLSASGATPRRSERSTIDIFVDVVVRHECGLVVPPKNVCKDECFSHCTYREYGHLDVDLKQPFAVIRAVWLDPKCSRDFFLFGLDVRDDDDFRALLRFVLNRLLLVSKAGPAKCSLK